MSTKITFSTSSEYDYDTLQKKYNNFMVPAFEVKVGGKNIQQGSSYISQLEIVIPVTVASEMRSIEMSECNFTISGIFDMKNSSFKSDVLDNLKTGTKVEVAGGYGSSLTVLFVGLLQHVRVSYGEGGVNIQVSTYDSTILLRNARKFALYENEDKNALIKKILQACTKDGLATLSDSNIGTFGGEKVRLEQAGLDDCEFITTLARRERFSFAIIHGQIILKNLIDELKAIMKLTYGKNIFSFDLELDTTKQVGKVVARSIHDKERKGVEGSADSVSVKKSGGKAAIEFPSLQSKIKSNIIEYKDPLENTKDGLDKIAQAVLDEKAMNFVSGRGMCIGLPELVPGRYIELDGMGKQVNGKYFISKVIHRFGPDGFTTQFDVKGAYSKWES